MTIVYIMLDLASSMISLMIPPPLLSLFSSAFLYVPTETLQYQAMLAIAEAQPLHIWDLETDFYIHNSRFDEIRQISSTPLTQWVSPFVMNCLPAAVSDENRVVKELIKIHSNDAEIIDYYSNFHYDHKLTSFEEHIDYQLSHLSRNLAPAFRSNFSPFEPIRRQQSTALKNPSLTGQSSTSSANSSSSDRSDDESESDEEDKSNRAATAPTSSSNNSSRAEDPVTLSSMFPMTNDIYGFEIRMPKKADMLKYG
uniref:Uncharacterized protein n=1 Tax=Anopheles maculatus TaxID=74869 RepID=A0A182SGU2_9DIPT